MRTYPSQFTSPSGQRDDAIRERVVRQPDRRTPSCSPSRDRHNDAGQWRRRRAIVNKHEHERRRAAGRREGGTTPIDGDDICRCARRHRLDVRRIAGGRKNGSSDPTGPVVVKLIRELPTNITYPMPERRGLKRGWRPVSLQLSNSSDVIVMDRRRAAETDGAASEGAASEDTAAIEVPP